MPKDRPQQSREDRRRPFSAEAAAAAVGREQRAREEAIRAELGCASLRLSGELGYGGLTVQSILDATGTSRSGFYARVSGKAECYASGYAFVIDRLCADLLAPGKLADDWLGGFEGALEALARFAAADPVLARGALAEVYVAGGAALIKRTEVFERLSRAIDRARRETIESRHSPPPSTAPFILNAIEAAVIRTFADDHAERFAASIPDLLYLATALYFGTDAARVAYRRARRRG